MNYNYIFLSLFFKIFCGYICVILSVDSSQRNIFVQFIKIIIKVHEQNSTELICKTWTGLICKTWTFSKHFTEQNFAS